MEESEGIGSEARKAGKASAVRRGDWVVRAAIVLMAAFFVLIIVERKRVRAHWWAYRLGQTDQLAQQAHYLSCLIAEGPSGLGAIQGLAASANVGLRVMAVHALRAMPVEVGLSDLTALARDSDIVVRESAALGLALRSEENSLVELRRLAKSESEDTASAAVAALGRTQDGASLKAICEAAVKHASPLVRAQAAEALMDVVVSSTSTSQSAATRNMEGCDPIETLRLMKRDTGEFTRWLSLERQTAAAASFAKAESAVDGPARKRTVGDVAGEMLTKLKR